MQNSIIATGTYTTLRQVIWQVVEGAGLALLRGPAGIGKTFALDRIVAELEEEGVTVIHLTASPAIGGSISAFTRSVLAKYRIESSFTSEAVEALADQLAGYPFRGYGPRVVFIIDEAQELKPAVLETIRELWDRGARARLGDGAGPAFGCVLVGNDTFMCKGGNQRTAGFRPLLSRVTHNMGLPRPTSSEHVAYALSQFPDSEELQMMLCGFGEDSGHLRAQEVAARQARLMAKGEPVTPSHLRMAIKMMGGKR